MKGRAYAIDLLRGLAIVGMVLSGNFGWNPALPAWLFHAQVPPPDFTFDPSLPGITWVDLVFPFFLFSMGAAFPFSLGRKLDRGVRPAAIVGGILRRGVLLAFFAVALGNLSMWRLNEVLPQPALRALLTLAVWGGYFALFIRLPALSKGRNDLLNACGAVWLVAMMLLYRRLGVPVSVERSDIIILVLANVVVAGSFVWWATRRRPLARLGVVALLVALKIGASVPGSWNETLWNASFAPWLYRAEFMKYLCIVLPGSIAGDLVARWLARRPEAGERPADPVRTYLAAGLVLLAVPVNMWGLFTRHLTANLLLTVALGGAAWLLLRRPRTETEGLLARLVSTGFFWLLLGLAFEAFEGGIKKDHATISYFFVTVGLASFVVTAATVWFECLRPRAGLLVRCGQNPMAAYVAAGYVIVPLLTLLACVVPLPWLWGGSGCAMSLFRGVLITALMVLLTAGFSKHGWFWRT